MAICLCLPMTSLAQNTKVLTPEQKLEQAQKQLEEAQKAVEEAKANAEKAKKAAQEAKQKAENEAKVKALKEKQAAIQEQIKKAQEETAKLRAEAEKLNAEANSLNTMPNKSESSDTNWSVPAVQAMPKTTKTATKKDKKHEAENGYYLADAVPTVDGKVVFTIDIDVPGTSAEDIYNTTYNYIQALTQDEKQKEGGNSMIALVNKEEHIIAARLCEWIVFSSTFISLDRTEFNYTLIATCSDSHLNLTLSRINYTYEEGRSSELRINAEEWITDKYGLNKSQTKLSRMSGKFRKGTIDRKNEIFEGIKGALE